MRFKPGQEVTPKIQNDAWDQLLGMAPMPFPEFGKVYTVSSYPMPHFDEMLSLEEFGDRYLYWERNFEPLVPAEKLAEDLEEVMSIEDQIRSIPESLRHLLHG